MVRVHVCKVKDTIIRKCLASKQASKRKYIGLKIEKRRGCVPDGKGSVTCSLKFTMVISKILIMVIKRYQSHRSDLEACYDPATALIKVTGSIWQPLHFVYNLH